MKDFPKKEKKKPTTYKKRQGSRRTKVSDRDKMRSKWGKEYEHMPPMMPVETRNKYEKLEKEQDEV